MHKHNYRFYGRGIIFTGMYIFKCANCPLTETIRVIDFWKGLRK